MNFRELTPPEFSAYQLLMYNNCLQGDFLHSAPGEKN